MAMILTPIEPREAWFTSPVCDGSKLLDRFWDAVAITPTTQPTDKRISVCSLDQSLCDGALPTPEIFAMSNSRPTIDLTQVLRSSSYEPKGESSTRQVHGDHRMDILRSQDIDVTSSMSRPAPQVTIQPATPTDPRQISTIAPRKPRLIIPEHGCSPQSGISSPGTAILAMASNFLSFLVRQDQTQPTSSAVDCEKRGLSYGQVDHAAHGTVSAVPREKTGVLQSIAGLPEVHPIDLCLAQPCWSFQLAKSTVESAEDVDA